MLTPTRVFICSLLVLVGVQSPVAQSQGSRQPPADLVDPFIGTGGHGHTYPGASLPFGMVQLSPDTRVEGWDACAGYHYSDSVILGFSHTHLSGTGVGDYGDLLLMPFRPSHDPARIPRSGFRHEAESASPGYYSVELDDEDIQAELTVSRRGAFHRYSLHSPAEMGLFIDLQHGIGPDEVIASELVVQDDYEVRGYRRSKGWAKDQQLFFIIRFSAPLNTTRIVSDGSELSGARSASGTALSAFLVFADLPENQLLVKVGISSVDTAGARQNLDKEIPDWDFDRVRRDAASEWNKELSRVQVWGDSEARQRIFYTALYHSFLSPNTFSDVDGRYRGMDGRIHTADDYTRYTVFSLWDTFRATHPLFTILQRERSRDFIHTFLNQYREGGLLPVWELAANETWCMIGYHSVPVILDAYVKGIRDFDASLALEAMKTSAEQDHFGLPSCRLYGYIPREAEHESVSKLLEYAYDDWCISRMAAEMGREQDATTYGRRAQYYRNLFDPATGFMRPRSNGNWLSPFHPFMVTNDYTEANAWQYRFFVPQDIEGLIELNGGREAFAARLDGLFEAPSTLEGRNQADISGMIGQYAHGNEPSHHVAYLYNFAGQPWKTQERVRDILDRFYADSPDGLSGNEDCGQMSAWYVFSALGFYPVTPGTPQYIFGTSLFDSARIKLDSGHELLITSHRGSPGSKYIQSVRVNNRVHRKSYINHGMIMAGGVLAFELGDEPNPTWGSGEEDLPPKIPMETIVPAPLIVADGPTFSDSVLVTLQSPIVRGDQLFYSVSGTGSDRHWKNYEHPLFFDSTVTVQAIAKDSEGRTSTPSAATFRKVEQIGTITLLSPFSPQYPAGGDAALIDHLRGTINFRTGGWQGYEGNDLDVVIDLGRIRVMDSVSCGFLQDIDSWIFFPTHVEFLTSTDGTSYKSVATRHPLASSRQEGPLIEELRADLGSVRARYIRIRAKNIGRCPPWHKGSGNKAWLFADEITVFPASK